MSSRLWLLLSDEAVADADGADTDANGVGADGVNADADGMSATGAGEWLGGLTVFGCALLGLTVSTFALAAGVRHSGLHTGSIVWCTLDSWVLAES